MGAGRQLLAQVLAMGGNKVKHLTKLASPQSLTSQKNSYSPKTKTK